MHIFSWFYARRATGKIPRVFNTAHTVVIDSVFWEKGTKGLPTKFNVASKRKFIAKGGVSKGLFMLFAHAIRVFWTPGRWKNCN